MNELELRPFAQETLEKRYLLRDEDGKIIETPYELFNRVATAVAEIEITRDSQTYWKHEFLDMLIKKDFMPNTPTLMNAGKEGGQLSACFVLPIEDSMEGIFGTLKDAAMVHKTGGGTGFDFSRLRPEGAMVSNKTGVSTGPLAFCQVYDKATEVIKQGSSRRGANMMNLRVDHPDIVEFIKMKEPIWDEEEEAWVSSGVMTNFNVSVTITNEFMEAVFHDTDYELKHESKGITEKLRAREVWDKIAENAWKSGEPGIIFIDRVNERSAYWERIEATNPCGEQPLPPHGSCNLGSINIANFVEKEEESGIKYINWDRLGDVVRTSVRFLDNVIDANTYPTDAITEHAKRYRNIGLGIMGWADALIKLRISYNSEAALELAEKVQRFINVQAHEYSWDLGKEKGIPSAAPFKTFYDYSNSERRNATLTTVAPTGTISIFAGCSSGIEPNFAYRMERHQLETVTFDLHPLYEAALNNGGVDKNVFVEAHSVTPHIHVLMQAAFQKHCDSAISKTINLPESATVADVEESYLSAWREGCKGVTVYRDGSREGVLHRKDEPKSTFENYCTDCGIEMVNESGCMTCLSCGSSKCLIA